MSRNGPARTCSKGTTNFESLRIAIRFRPLRCFLRPEAPVRGLTHPVDAPIPAIQSVGHMFLKCLETALQEVDGQKPVEDELSFLLTLCGFLCGGFLPLECLFGSIDISDQL